MPALLSAAQYRQKTADLGGDGNDTNFEASFANLAAVYLQDKAPTLLDHAIGFQLLDRAEDDRKATGLTVFRVGNQSLYAPLVFIDGKIKGHELLYLPKQDLMLPLKEKWLNYLLSRRPQMIGAGVPQNMQRLGVRQPDLRTLGKFAAACLPEAREFLPLYGHVKTAGIGAVVAEARDHFNTWLRLDHFIQQAPEASLLAARDLFRRRPKIAAAFDRWHGLQILDDAIRDARRRASSARLLDDPWATKTADPVYDLLETTRRRADPKLAVYVRDAGLPIGSPLSDTEKETLLSQGVLVRDNRAATDVSTLHAEKLASDYANPTCSGVYNVLLADGSIRKCAVIVGPCRDDTAAAGTCVVVPVDATTQARVVPQTAVWVSQPPEDLSWTDWFKTLPKVSAETVSAGIWTSLRDQSTSRRFIFVDGHGRCTCPYTPYKAYGDGGVVGFGGKFSDHVPDAYDVFVAKSRTRSNDPRNTPRRDINLKLSKRSGDAITCSRGVVQLSEDTRVIGIPDDLCELPKTDTAPLLLGGPTDVALLLTEKTAKLEIRYDADRYTVNGMSVGGRPQAVQHLVAGHGLTEKDAGFALREAARSQLARGSAFRCRIKHAFPYGPQLPTDSVYAPAFPEQPPGDDIFGGRTPTVGTLDEELPIESLRHEQPETRYDEPAPQDLQYIQRAVQSGQRELFDAGMIRIMLKAVSDESLVEQYIPSLLKGVDSLGKLLFTLYTHYDKFADRFGKQTLPELEDSLRTQFEGLGDIVLVLKQKTIDADPDEALRSLDLSSASP